jgi:hypothetical protein
LSHIARALSFNAFAFFTTNAGAPTTALGIGVYRIAVTTSQDWIIDLANYILSADSFLKNCKL